MVIFKFGISPDLRGKSSLLAQRILKKNILILFGRSDGLIEQRKEKLLFPYLVMDESLNGALRKDSSLMN